MDNEINSIIGFGTGANNSRVIFWRLSCKKRNTI